jgi:predicted TIM-barrel fold metal-dependent hydrolase
MPIQDYMKLISVDDHVIEHPRVWQDRLPAKYREAGPTLLRTVGGERAGALTLDAGRDVWTYEGQIHVQIALNAVAGWNWEDYGLDPYRFDQMRPGCYDPAERIKDMDVDGVWAQLCFPSFPRFAGTFFLQSQDRGLGLACVQAYNDFILDEWCGYAPDRLIPMVILPLWDIAACVAEIERTVAKGARAVTFPENPVPLGLPSWYTPHWDPVFAAVQEADIPLCMHFGTSGQMPSTSPDAPFAVGTVLMGTNSMAATCDLIFSPVFYKFPRLKVALSEGGIGWVPYLLERADHIWERHRFYDSIDKETRPSDLFRRHIWGCFIDDEFGLASRAEIGVDRIMWEGDYPHADSDWPNTGTRARQLMENVPDDETHRIIELNARELFNFHP